MKTLKKAFRFLALILIIALASVLPVPITFYKKDDLPKYQIEQIDTEDKDTENEDAKEIF
jgi:hypothetical protein